MVANCATHCSPRTFALGHAPFLHLMRCPVTTRTEADCSLLLLQRQVLAFYRVVLRAARARDAALRVPIQAYARSEFERCAAGWHPSRGEAGSALQQS
jgi:hypothetical protein